MCPAGSYINEENSNNCDPCPQGSFTNETDSTSCTPCPTGTMTSSNGAASCCEYGEQLKEISKVLAYYHNPPFRLMKGPMEGPFSTIVNGKFSIIVKR